MDSARVLVVEDSPQWQNTFRRVLEPAGYSVTVCKDAESALKQLRIRYYPVVVVDMRLEGDSDEKGLQLVREIDRLWFGHGIQTIVISGYPVSPDQTQQIANLSRGRNISFVSKGGTDTKGFDRAQFLSLVSLAIARMNRPSACLFSGVDCGRNIEPKTNRVFVAMPYSIKSSGITINMDDVYELGIKPGLREVQFDAVRADEKPLVGALICNICAGIQESAICLADITDWNPNVLFELGLMAGIGKTTIILKHAKSDIPTDLKFALYVEYDSIRSVKTKLKKVMKGILAGHDNDSVMLPQKPRGSGRRRSTDRPNNETGPTQTVTVSRSDHLIKELAELRDKYAVLTERISALDKELGRTLDMETKQILEERRGDRIAEREQALARIEQIESQLADGATHITSSDSA